MSWTDQKIQMLKDMWGNGFSASEIAKRLGGGLTRNAVIGKAHRLKLSGKASPIKVASQGGAAPAIKVKSTKRVMLRSLPLPPLPTQSGVLARAREQFRPIDIANKKAIGISVTKATERHCRWPIGDPRSADFRFCGCTAHEGLPYCVDHARVAYQTVSRRLRPDTGQEIEAPQPVLVADKETV
jgi:GcrA cell cycle regulator